MARKLLTPEMQRQAFELYVEQKLPLAHVAKVMNVTQDTAKKLVLKTIDPAGYERFVARQKEVAENYKKRKEATEENEIPQEAWRKAFSAVVGASKMVKK